MFWMLKGDRPLGSFGSANAPASETLANVPSKTSTVPRTKSVA